MERIASGDLSTAHPRKVWKNLYNSEINLRFFFLSTAKENNWNPLVVKFLWHLNSGLFAFCQVSQGRLIFDWKSSLQIFFCSYCKYWWEHKLWYHLSPSHTHTHTKQVWMIVEVCWPSVFIRLMSMTPRWSWNALWGLGSWSEFLYVYLYKCHSISYRSLSP